MTSHPKLSQESFKQLAEEQAKATVILPYEVEPNNTVTVQITYLTLGNMEKISPKKLTNT